MGALSNLGWFINYVFVFVAINLFKISKKFIIFFIQFLKDLY